MKLLAMVGVLIFATITATAGVKCKVAPLSAHAVRLGCPQIPESEEFTGRNNFAMFGAAHERIRNQVGHCQLNGSALMVCERSNAGTFRIFTCNYSFTCEQVADDSIPACSPTASTQASVDSAIHVDDRARAAN